MENKENRNSSETNAVKRSNSVAVTVHSDASLTETQQVRVGSAKEYNTTDSQLILRDLSPNSRRLIKGKFKAPVQVHRHFQLQFTKRHRDEAGPSHAITQSSEDRFKIINYFEIHIYMYRHVMFF